MTSSQQPAALQRQIWAIANDVRGAVDGWDFKQYVLGTLFYRFISENFASYIKAGDDSIQYAELAKAEEKISKQKAKQLFDSGDITWLVFGVHNKTHSVVVTDYRSEHQCLQSLKNQIMERMA